MLILAASAAGVAQRPVWADGVAQRPARAEPLHGVDNLTLLVPAEALPELSVQGADGAARRLAEFAGRGVLLNLWATWCAPCVAEMPALDALAARLAGGTSPITVLPVAMDRGGAAVVRAFYDSHHLTHLPVWLDPEGDALTAFKLRGIPTTFLLDAKGLARARWEGPIDWSGADVPERLARLLA